MIKAVSHSRRSCASGVMKSNKLVDNISSWLDTCYPADSRKSISFRAISVTVAFRPSTRLLSVSWLGYKAYKYYYYSVLLLLFSLSLCEWVHSLFVYQVSTGRWEPQQLVLTFSCTWWPCRSSQRPLPCNPRSFAVAGSSTWNSLPALDLIPSFDANITVQRSILLGDLACL